MLLQSLNHCLMRVYHRKDNRAEKVECIDQNPQLLPQKGISRVEMSDSSDSACWREKVSILVASCKELRVCLGSLHIGIHAGEKPDKTGQKPLD